MSKLILPLLVLTLIFPSQTHAEETRLELRQEARAEREENREQRRTEIESNRQEVSSRVAENHANRLERRFALYVKRFENIISRLQKRLDILKSQNIDTTSLQSSLGDIKTKLTEAQTKGAAAVAAFRAIDPARFAEQKPELLAARDLANAARALFKEVHSLIKDVLKDLKVVSKPALPAASSAVQNSN